MIHSMTAFATAEVIEESFSVSVEIRSYNSRHLDIVIRHRPEFAMIEKKIKDRIQKVLKRGRVEIQVKIDGPTESDISFEFNNERAAAFDRILGRIKEDYGWAPQVSVDFLAGAGGMLNISKIETDLAERWPAIEACLDQALNDLSEMRKTEGAYIAQDIGRRLAGIHLQLEQVDRQTETLVSLYQQRLSERIRALTDGVVQIDPSRIAQEAALLADRSDISEEIVRTRSHIDQFQAIMGMAGASGRRLNFLIQEMNRELNTMGAKVGNAQISHIIVEMKSELEKIREQVQNIE